MRWADFELAAPELASVARERLEQHHLCLVGTLRRDGWPRISPVEPYIVEGELLLGMMWRSRKALDLLRDPRIVVHSVVTDWSGTEGDVKLYGTVTEVQDPEPRTALLRAVDVAHGWEPGSNPLTEFHSFSVDIRSAGYARFTSEAWESWTWTPEGGLHRQSRPND